MRVAAAPANDAADLYQRISARRRQKKTKDALSRMRMRVESAYASYSASAPLFTGLAPLVNKGSTDYSRLYSQYDLMASEPRPDYDALLSRLASALCSYCLDGEVTNLDHLVPRTAHPEFSILPINLIPVCGRCNQIKSFPFVSGPRAPLHPFFDRNLPHCIWSVSLSHVAPDPDVRYSLVTPTSGDLGLTVRVWEHARRLRLPERFRTAALGEMTEAADVTKMLIDAGAPVADVLASHAESKARARRDRRAGVNHWKTVLYEALESDVAFASTGYLSWL